MNGHDFDSDDGETLKIDRHDGDDSSTLGDSDLSDLTDKL